jgi:NAD(P)H dehydrogenase (quinone)
MKVLLVHAHPEPRSLSAALKSVAIATLERAGHTVRVSDLYAERWKAAFDRDDFPALDRQERLHPPLASKVAFAGGTQTNDVVAEQEKLLWADALVLNFPLWWFGMPAILKGWVDRVFAYGFAYGVGEHSEQRWGDRYGEGTFAGKRALVVTTAGGWAEHYADRGVNGPIEDLLFPITHGMLFYGGFDVLPSVVIYRADTLDSARFETASLALQARLLALETTAPIPFRRQNFGDYHIPSGQLRDGLEPAGTSGFALHRVSPATELLARSAGEGSSAASGDAQPANSRARATLAVNASR